MQDVIDAIQQFGFPIVAMVGLGYFVYFVWTTITEKIDPAIEDMKMTILSLIDQIRMLDNDMIRLQKKLDTVLQLKENEERIEALENTVKEKEVIIEQKDAQIEVQDITIDKISNIQDTCPPLSIELVKLFSNIQNTYQLSIE